MFLAMRITLTVDDDVTALLKRLRKTRGANLKDLINEALRRGLRDMTAGPKQRVPVHTRSVDLGRGQIASIDNIADVLAIAEIERSD
jgi:hypothetical protein